MKCRGCGAENAAHMKTCGRCGLSLESSDVRTITEKRASSSAGQVLPKDVASRGPQRRTPGPSTRRVASILLTGGAIYFALAGFELLTSYFSDEERTFESAFTIILRIGFAVLLLVTAIRLSRPDSRTAQYVWESGDHLAPVAEARGVDIIGLLVIATVFVSSVAIAVFVLEHEALLLSLAILAVLITTALAIALSRTRVMMQGDSILVGQPTSLVGASVGPMMFRLPFDKIQSVKLRGRVLRVVLTDRIGKASPRTFRYLILGDPKPIAAAVQAIGVMRGKDFSIDGVEVDPKLLGQIKDSLQKQELDRSQGAVPGWAPDERPVLPKESQYPVIVSVLLLAAGLSTLFTAFILLLISEGIVDLYGVHIAGLECCVILEFIFAILIMAGALMAFRQKRYGLVRASAIIAIISVGLLVSVITGVVALYLLAKSKDQFES